MPRNKKKKDATKGIENPDEIKDLGNAAFTKGEIKKAIELFSKAIEMCDTNAIYFSNSKCYSKST